MNISEKIKAGRENKGWTQMELATGSGVSLDSIKRYESKNSNITIENLIKIADALEVDLNFFKSDKFVTKLLPSPVTKSQKFVTKLSPSETFPSETSKISPQTLNDRLYSIPKLNLSAQAGGGNEILDLQCYESGEVLTIDKAFFKAVPSKNLKAIRVDGYSMMPMLTPDSWVVFEDDRQYRGDGLYIINYGGQLMVKLLQLNPINKILDIISVNKDYKSYSIPLEDNQVELIIAGKVLRCIV